MVPTGHPLNHPTGMQSQSRESQTLLQGDTAPNNPNRPSQIQRHSVSQATAKGENDNCLIEISERPANTVTMTLFKTPPQAPSAVITDYWRSHCVGARSSCPAYPENWNNISLPKIRSDIRLAASTMSKSCLGSVLAPQPALPHGLPPYGTTGSATQLRPEPQQQQAEHCGQPRCRSPRSTAFTS